MESLGCQVEVRVPQVVLSPSYIWRSLLSLSAPAMNNTFYGICKDKCQCFKQSEQVIWVQMLDTDKSTIALVPEHVTETLNLPFSSISLLGKPPHSSIMTMATGKNLTSIPKKVGGPSDLNCPHIILFCFVPVLMHS